MRVELDYGKSGISAEVPDTNLTQVLRLGTAPALEDADAAIRAAIAAPIGIAPLAELAVGAESVCIVVCDVTRPVPNQVMLPPVLETLHAAGVRRAQVTILVATGTHRPNLGAELDALIGAETAARYEVVNHDCRNYDAHRWIGASPNGVPVWLDRVYCDSDLRITLGLIEPHFMAGYSGGRKIVMPGLAALATVQHWHCPRFLESPLATNGVIDGNPVHEESLAIAKLAPPSFSIDVTLDERNRTTGVFAGHFEQAWREGVRFADSLVRVKVDEQADIVITTCAGYPLDATFYQAVKGMVGALPAVKRGGTIIIAAACAEGIGSPEFAATLLETDDLEEFVTRISEPDVFIPEEWEVEELAKAVRHNDVIVVCSGIDAETLSRCFVTPAASVEAAIAMALKKHGPDASIIAIPRGPYVIPEPIS